MSLSIRGHDLDFSSTIQIMGILNVTPDSFSDGAQFTSEEAIFRHGAEMIQAGVNIIDIGGESSRPFAQSVDIDTELARVIPAVKIIRRQSSVIPISIDTTKAEVAKQAIKAGADIINDISALRFDPQMLDVAKQNACPVIIMHMLGNPGDMQVNPTYDDVIKETIDFFQKRITWLVDRGIDRRKIIIDPGIGFGKTVEHNLTILNNLQKYQTVNCPVLIGHSRKSFMTHLLGNKLNRDNATAAISAICATKQVAIIRVHNVKINREAVQLAQAIQQQSE